MNRNIFGYVMLAVFVGVMYYLINSLFVGKPAELRELETELKYQQEKLISAQILASELDRVSSLIGNNLAASAQDSLAADANLPFLNDMVALLESLGCEITSMKTFPRDRGVKEYIRTPYLVAFRGNYRQFGEFINQMEKSDRLVTMESFKIDNNLTQLNFAKTFEDLKIHDFQVKMSTLTLVRSDSKKGAGK